MSNSINTSERSVFYLNEIGGRGNLEDSISPNDAGNPGVYIVCDGVGGNSSGEVASRLAVEAFYQTFSNRYEQLKSELTFKELITDALQLFKEKVRDFITENPAARNTSTTLTLAIIKEGKVYIAWCGDSRVYLVSNGQVKYRTADHSLVQELVATGVITEAEAETHPQKNVILRSLNAGAKPDDIAITIKDLTEGDWLLLCTDGLMEQFSEHRFSEVLGSYKSDCDYADSINKLCQGKTKDNYSMYLVNYQGKAVAKKSKLALLAGLLLLIVIGAFAFNRFAGNESNVSDEDKTSFPSQTPPATSPDNRKSLFIDKGQDTLQQPGVVVAAPEKKEKKKTPVKDTVKKMPVPVAPVPDTLKVNKPDSL